MRRVAEGSADFIRLSPPAAERLRLEAAFDEVTACDRYLKLICLLLQRPEGSAGGEGSSGAVEGG